MPSTVAVLGHLRLNDRIGPKRLKIKRFNNYRMVCKRMTFQCDSLVSFFCKKLNDLLPRNAAPFQSGKSATRKIYFVPLLHPESTFNFPRNQLRARPAEWIIESLSVNCVLRSGGSFAQVNVQVKGGTFPKRTFHFAMEKCEIF